MVFLTDCGIQRGLPVGLCSRATRVLHNGNLHDTAAPFAYSTTKTMDNEGSNALECFRAQAASAQSEYDRAPTSSLTDLLPVRRYP
jgi:hypothetical protein